jgi:hypothetical protein
MALTCEPSIAFLYSTAHGFAPQISAAHSAIVRSLENFPELATFAMTLRAQPSGRKPEGESDFYFVEADDPEAAVPRIVELVKTRIPRRFGLDPIRGYPGAVSG